MVRKVLESTKQTELTVYIHKELGMKQWFPM